MSHEIPLGKNSDYVDQYNPQLLFAIARAEGRSRIQTSVTNMHGVDIWQAYELSWLNTRGKPEVAYGRFFIPCTSANLIESKSLKLYLNSFNQTRFADKHQVANHINKDLSACAGAEVEVALYSAEEWAQFSVSDSGLPGECIDGLDIDIEDYQPNADLLKLEAKAVSVSDHAIHSHLLRSTCPVTGQPDWGSVLIRYSGCAIDKAGLLKYIVSFRQHQGFHEQCIEQMYADIQERCQPTELLLIGYYLRRGGLDINPVRSSHSQDYDLQRIFRQ